MTSHLTKSIAVLTCALMLGCAGSKPTVFLNPEYDFSSVERVAVIPFDNLTTDQGMGDYMTRIFITQLLATKTFDVVEPGEVTHFLVAKGITRTSELTVDQLKDLGSTLNVQSAIFGTVGESTQLRSGNLSSQIVSLDTRMVSTDAGATVWSAAVASGGPGLFARMFGVGEQTRSDAVRAVVKNTIRTLIK